VHRRKRKGDYDKASRQRATVGGKPNRLFVLQGGEVDASCEGKNAWDAALRDLVPKIIDISVVDWERHKPHTLKKLRDSLDKEFEYVGHPLSMMGFRTSLTRFLKSERSRLKGRWLRGQKSAPVKVNPDQWTRLIAYWKTDAQKLKASRMAAARQGVKNYTLVGRKGKVGKEAAVVSVHITL
jgi:hypothetical protein